MGVLTDLADAITAELNDASRSWNGQFHAERMNIPVIKRENTTYLSVIVTPLDKTTTTITRGKTQDVCRYLLGFQRQLHTGDNDETDPLISLVEDVQEYFDQGIQLATFAAACEQADVGTDAETPWMATTDNEGLMLFTAVLRLTFRKWR